MVILVFLLFLVSALGWTAKIFFSMIYNEYAYDQFQRDFIGHTKKVYVTKVLKDVICDTCDPCYTMCFSLLRVTSIHSIQKITKLRNSEIIWRVTKKRNRLIHNVKVILILVLKSLFHQKIELDR